jgi:hypothetical protein
MLNTLKTLPKAVKNNPVSVAVQEAAVNVFSANMNVLYVTRDEGKKVFFAVKGRAGVLVAANVELLKGTVDAANDKVHAAWDSVEQVLEARVIPVLGKVGLAGTAQFGVDLVGKGLDKVSAQVVVFTGAPKAKRVVAKKPVAKKAVARKPAAPRSILAA